MDYNVDVKTGFRQNAETDANVFITLIGTSGQTREMRIDHPKKDDFEKGRSNVFGLGAEDVGDLTQIRVRHDNSGRQPGWYLRWILIEVEHDNNKKEWRATCNTWLATDEGDGKIDRTFDLRSV